MYPRQGRHEEEDIAPTVEEYLPAAHKRQEELEVEKYDPAAQGAKAVMIINPLPPFPLLELELLVPGRPPTPTPATYPFAVIMLKVCACIPVILLPEVPDWVRAEPSWMHPPRKDDPPPPPPIELPMPPVQVVVPEAPPKNPEPFYKNNVKKAPFKIFRKITNKLGEYDGVKD